MGRRSGGMRLVRMALREAAKAAREAEKHAQRVAAIEAHEAHQQSLLHLQSALKGRNLVVDVWDRATQPLPWTPQEFTPKPYVRSRVSAVMNSLFTGIRWKLFGLAALALFGPAVGLAAANIPTKPLPEWAAGILLAGMVVSLVLTGKALWVFFRYFGDRYRSALEVAEQRHQTNEENRLLAFELQEAERHKQWSRDEAEKQALREAGQGNDPGLLADFLLEQLDQQRFPIPVSFDAEMETPNTVSLQMLLPELDAVPETNTSLTTRGRLSEKRMAIRDRVAIYDELCCGIALRLVYETFRILPMVESVSLQGTIPDEISDGEAVALSLATTREMFRKARLDNHSAHFVLEQFGGKFGRDAKGNLKALSAKVLEAVPQTKAPQAEKPTLSTPQRCEPVEEVIQRKPQPSLPENSIGEISISLTYENGGYYQQHSTEDLSKHWHGVEKRVDVSGFSLPGGLVYKGDGRGRTGEPSFLDTSCKVARNGDFAGASMGYWPSYSQISPEARHAYLHWLQNGRATPDVYIGYVFLFFYGLERRIILDAKTKPEARKELKPIRDEVIRLRSLYAAQSGSFNGYSREFLQALGFLEMEWHGQHGLSEGSAEWLWVLSVGKQVRDGLPLSAAQAFAWMKNSELCRWRTPGQRCAQEVSELFALRYRTKFRDGLVVKPNKTELAWSYRPASSALPSQTFRFPGIPDVRALSAPVKKLWDIAESAQSDLEPYSRFIGKYPDRADSAEAVSLLPPELAATRTPTEVPALRRRFSIVLTDNSRELAKPVDIVQTMGREAEAKLNKAAVVSLTKVLEMASLGIEPDPRFGGGGLDGDATVSVFSLDGVDAPQMASAEYLAAMLYLDLAGVVGMADGVLTASEEQAIENHLEQTFQLTEGEQRRLKARLHLHKVSPPKLSALRKRLTHLSTEQRAPVSKLLAAIAGADGSVTPDEVEFLAKIFKELGLPEVEVYSTLHSLASSRPAAGEPVLVEAGQTPTAFKLPSRKKEQVQTQNGIALDHALIQRTLRETAAASALLHNIFAEEASVTPSAHVVVHRYAGLNERLSALLDAIAGREEWNRNELEVLASEQELGLDGALESLNECAFDRVGDPLTEGDDPITIDTKVLEELRRES